MFNVPSFFGFRSGSYGIPFVGLLDTYGGAAAAYSLRGLSNPYVNSGTPYACQVRNSSNATADIGFVYNPLTGEYDLDTSALLAHCGGGNGFVTEWYDQSGNGRNATQGTALNQPQIVSSGSVLTLTGVGSARPILRFDGINDSFDFSTITAPQFTTFYPSKKAVNADLSAWFSTSSGVGSPYTPITFGTAGTYIGNSIRTTYSSSYNNNGYILMSGYINSGNIGFIQINNSPIALPNVPFVDPGTDNFNTINRRSTLDFSKCDVPEMIFYDFNASAVISAINTNINNYYGIY